MMIRKKFLQIHIIFVSGLCVHFTFKICQIVASTSMIRQFREFFQDVRFIISGLVDIVKNNKIELVYKYDDW